MKLKTWQQAGTQSFEFINVSYGNKMFFQQLNHSVMIVYQSPRICQGTYKSFFLHQLKVKTFYSHNPAQLLQVQTYCENRLDDWYNLNPASVNLPTNHMAGQQAWWSAGSSMKKHCELLSVQHELCFYCIPIGQLSIEALREVSKTFH